LEIKKAVRINEKVRINPGTNPAMKSPEIDVLATTPKIINGLLGGIRIPRVPPVAATPEEKPLE
jgi:hypothetical protein